MTVLNPAIRPSRKGIRPWLAPCGFPFHVSRLNIRDAAVKMTRTCLGTGLSASRCASLQAKDKRISNVMEHSPQKSLLPLHDYALVAAGGLTRVLALLHLANHEVKGLLHVLVVAGRGLCPGALEFLGEGAAVFGGDLALLGAQIGLVAYDDEGDPGGSLRVGMSAGGAEWRGKEERGTHQVVQDLIADHARHFEALLARDRVDNHVAVDADEVLRVQDAVLILR